ncbi:hypothetical protein COLO4_27453 [Corchorus olitorius]|uniref:Uncharacterized protein n=1 Tax=Corchorus olitorius TaxID=93759 RepID=A0A1R3HRL7_9ROSI|nr:hypothetical protein COLO4_27453 [Corchorus olitorius]
MATKRPIVHHLEISAGVWREFAGYSRRILHFSFQVF